MAGSSGSSKLLFLVDLVFTYRPNSPLKRCSNHFSDSFLTEFSEVRADTLDPWFACEGSNPFETSQARADTVGLPGVASGNCTPCGIRSIGNPDAASILPVQLKNEMSAVAS